ncbi:PREDICTED: uncharacterized protein LOC109222405 [Nicotiana attenuata]|nr:PREDICTED: uncharacterized protein LOC109222405 [Nicotiana attenuata]
MFLIDLGSEFFLIKFQKEENLQTALHGGPWFVLNHFLSVRQWEAKFIASNTQLTYSAIWVRLPELPTVFYDMEILQRVGAKLGKLLKVDICTTTTSRGRYARICIEVPLEKPLKTHLHIGNHKQTIQYEGLNVLCTACGRFGHALIHCTFQTQPLPTSLVTKSSRPQSASTSSTTHYIPHPTSNHQSAEWQTVSFPKRNNNRLQ